MLASEMYASSLGARCGGPDMCHWCGGGCERRWVHDDPPPLPFVKTHGSAKFPTKMYVCEGCRLFRRPRVTVPFLGGGFKDGRPASSYGWLITPFESSALGDGSYKDLCGKLLAPPLYFCLSLVEDHKVANLLHLMEVNDNPEVKADTPLHFTVNNIRHTYTVYELEKALKGGGEGREPGVRALVRILGSSLRLPELVKEADGGKGDEARGRGRPVKDKDVPYEPNPLKRVVS
jgi:hypothetical protein